MNYISVELPGRGQTARATDVTSLRWKVFVRRFVIVLVALVLGIGLLNFLVNPEGIYATRLLPPVTWNTRPAKAELLVAQNPKPQALLLGSSRLMTIPPSEVERITGLKTFNAAVNAAYTEDFYVLLRYAVEHGVQPKLVLIGLDAEAFHDHEPENDYLLQPNDLGALLQKGERRGERWREFTILFTGYQTKLSFVSLYDRLGGKKVNAVDFNADGSLAQDPWLREGARVNLAARLESTKAEYSTRYKSYTAVSPARLDYFAQTLRYAREHGAHVIVFATPVHPELERALAQYGYGQRKSEAYAAARKVCADNGAEFLDFTAPESFGGAPEHFYDGVHVDATNAQRLIGAVLKTHAVQ